MNYAVWLTLALVNAGLAQGKGRRGLLWFLFSLLFGPFATFLIVIFPQRRARARGTDEEDTSAPSDEPPGI